MATYFFQFYFQIKNKNTCSLKISSKFLMERPLKNEKILKTKRQITPHLEENASFKLS